MLSLLLAWAPLCLLATLLLSGRFVGEERILRRVRGHQAVRRALRARPVRTRRVIVRSRLECASLSGRGPPRGIAPMS